MKAHAFFFLLNELYRLEASETLMSITASSIPHMEKSDSSRVISELRIASNDIIELDLEDKDDYSNLDKLQGML